MVYVNRYLFANCTSIKLEKPHIKRRMNRDADIEKRLVDTEEDGEGGMN